MKKKIILVSIISALMILLLSGCISLLDDDSTTTKQLKIEFEQDEFVYDGNPQQPVPIVMYGDDIIDCSNYEIEYSNNIDAGNGKITLKIEDDIYIGTKSYNFEIKPKSLGYISCIPPTTYQYTGNAILPSLDMVYSKNTEDEPISEATLLTSNDYELVATNNINIGTATLTLNGINNYAGTVNFPFEIVKRDVSNLTATAYPDIITYEEGETYTPKISQIQDGKSELNLVENVDYTLSYENNNNIGLASIVVTGKGPNCDESKSFTINFEITNETTYNIAFHNVDNQSFNTITKKYNQSISKPDDNPIKQNQTINWYEDAEYSIPFYFDKMPLIENATNTKILFGRWENLQGNHFFDKTYSDDILEINSHEELIQLIDYITFNHITSENEAVVFNLTYVSSNKRSDEVSSAIEERLYPAMKISTHLLTIDNDGIKLWLDEDDSIFEPNTNTPNLETKYKQLDSINYVEYNSSRDECFDNFAINDKPQTDDIITTSNQLYFTLEYGYRPRCATNSTAERLFNKMKDVLREIIDDNMSDYEKTKAIYEWLILNITYDYDALSITYDSEIDDPNNPAYFNCYYLEGVFDDKVAVCDGISKAFTSLCQIEGINSVRIVGIANQDEGYENHAWNKVNIDNQWYIVDSTWGNSGLSDKKAEYLNYHNFLISEKTKEDYGCTGNKFNNILCLGEIDYYQNQKYFVEDKQIVADYFIESQVELNDLLVFCYDSIEEPLTGKTVNFHIDFDYGNDVSLVLTKAKTAVYTRTNELFENYSWSICGSNSQIVTIIFQ